MQQYSSGVTAIVDFLQDIPGQVRATVIVPGDGDVGVDFNERGEFLSHPDDVSLFYALLLNATDNPESLLIVEHMDPSALQDGTFLYGFYFRNGQLLSLPASFLKKHYGSVESDDLHLSSPPNDWYEDPQSGVIMRFRPQDRDD